MELRNKPNAVFMAFGTKGDVFPLASLTQNLLQKGVACIAVSSPPTLSPVNENDTEDIANSFSLEKSKITREHRQECLSIFGRIFADGLSLENDVVVINFFALEGWSLAELYNIRCVVAAPYVVPYSAHSSFERHFQNELPHLYKYLKEAPPTKICWDDVIHWMWPLFTEDWGSWRSDELNLSPWPFTDPVTGLPKWHDRTASPLLLYGFSKEVVECPDYWPLNVRVCGFWMLPKEWQYSCSKCQKLSMQLSPECLHTEDALCTTHSGLQSFLKSSASSLVFISLSSVGSMGFLRNARQFLQVLQAALNITSHRFILLTAGCESLEAAIQVIAAESTSSSQQIELSNKGITLFGGRLFCFSGSIPYSWMFRRCDVAIHHGGSGSTAAALLVGIPQILCPFLFDQFYWADRMFWLGVSPEPLKRNDLIPVDGGYKSIKEAAEKLVRSISYALSPEVRACALEVAERLSLEDGLSEAVRILKEELSK
ncbi:sterol 3-beta-glucosyltransferase isoform X2 [Daucus carota subsp. sativus]|uniref:sterol 3-beta-glucosyltransferase isoform X2 n=1 Tax=Daucus carota subsp. sativus TaxID=79200 RepID=UPI0007EF6A30|nr:PREDICTED: sterol 3-beta-glucosyltransferase isoform X2 [Daucus carota subsp. sativus]